MKKIYLLFILCFGFSFTNAQNTCETALAITSGVYSIDYINGPDGPSPICSENGPVPGTAMGEWYTYTPTEEFTVTVTTDLPNNNGKDTRVHVYTGSCGNFTCFAGDDDSGDGYLSICTFNVIPGTTYYIAFDNRWSASGFIFQLIESPVVYPPISFVQQSITGYSSICSVADMNGDYLDDIFTLTGNTMTIHQQNATGGGFTDKNYTLSGLTATPSWSIAAGDFDRNGFNDLAFGDSNRLTVLKANDTGTGYTEIPYPQNIFVQRTNFVDINNDGNLDLFACHDVAQSHAYRNDGAGHLVYDTTFYPTLAVGGNYASIWTDYNNDGYVDMYLAKCRASAGVGDPQRINLLYKNNGNGTYTEVGAAAGVNDGSQSWSTAVEDFDNDGDMDFLISNVSDTNKFFRNNGDGTFTDIYAATGISSDIGSWELQAADFNNDGFVDFLWQNDKQLYLNNGDLTFTGYNLPLFSEGGIGDLNNDGFLDVQFGSSVFYNVPNENNWLKVSLKGTESNINGIGARVEIYGAWGKQIRDIRSGQGFSHMSSLNAYFGIGTATVVDKLIVRWPSGKVDIINEPDINHGIVVTEGMSSLATNHSENAVFNLFPNPAADVLHFDFNTAVSTITKADIYSLDGKLVLSPEVKNQLVNVHALASGTYVITLKNDDGKTFTQKFIKK